MKKTNVMIEVSEDLYDEVVHPYKKQKGFGKLVVQLLEAYRTNDSIYSYINGTMDKLEDEATQELIKDLNSMTQSLNMFGTFQNQAEVIIDEGQRTFDSFSEKANEDTSKFTSNNMQKETLTRDDVVSIVNESVSEIRGMLEKLLENKTVSAPIAETVNRVVESKANESVMNIITPKPVETPVVKEVEVNRVTKEEEDMAKNALGSLMGSIVF